jgi:hypothetical protein
MRAVVVHLSSCGMVMGVNLLFHGLGDQQTQRPLLGRSYRMSFDILLAECGVIIRIVDYILADN